MAIDPSIYAMSGRGVTPIEGPLDIAMKAAQVRQMGSQADLGQLKYQEGQQNFQDTQAMRDLAQRSGGDQNAFMEGLLKLGTPAAIGEHAKLQTERLQQSKIDKEARLAASQMNAEQLKQTQSLYSDLAKAAEWVKQGGVQAPQRWQQAMQHYPEQIRQMAGDYAPEKLDLAIAQAKSWEQIRKDEEGTSGVGKIEADYRAGKIDKATRDAAIKKETNIPPTLAQQLGSALGGQGSSAQAYAERLIKGLEPWPTTMSLRTDPVVREGVQLARQMDPEFNASTHKQREQTNKAFTTGKPAEVINALNTGMGHLSELSDLAEQLDNSSFKGYNSLKNMVKEQTGNPTITAFNTTKKAVADEVTRVWRGTGGSEKDIQEAMQNLDASNSPEQLRANILQLTKLMASKQKAMEDQYQKGMGKFGQIEILNDEAKNALDKIQRRAGVKKAPPTAGQGGAPVTKQFADAQGNMKTFKLSADGKSWEPI